MGFSAKNVWQTILGKGLRFGWSDGPSFDPASQKRTSAIADLVKKAREKDDEKVRDGSVQ
jgi:hypothetical protein